MTTDIEQIKKKIIYRSNYRGTKEMDKLLGALQEVIKVDLINLITGIDYVRPLINFFKNRGNRR